jgi:lipopolysaccharide/colanic/teichoic acid biosynthesis glycosyltransferase
VSLYRRLGKRALDLALAVPALCVAMPVVTAAAVAVRATMGAPAFFVQQRPGLGGRPFSLIKLRTMRHAIDQHGRLLDDAERLTPLGRVLRGASVDELPQLLNVVAGDMSLVGPRPLLMQYLGRYSEQQARRHEVKPGITGHAQVNGRNALGWDDKFRLDVWYVDHVGFGIDLAILAKTALKVVQRSGISAQGEATMREFMGTPSPSSSTTSTPTTTTTTTTTETA